MTKKMLALGLSAFTAACGTSAPVGPSLADVMPASVAEEASLAAADATPRSCKGVVEVQLRAGKPTRQGVEVTASYLGLPGEVSSCPAPSWSSQPDAKLLARKDPFKVLAPRLPGTTYAVTASAPGGPQGSIKLEF